MICNDATSSSVDKPNRAARRIGSNNAKKIAQKCHLLHTASAKNAIRYFPLFFYYISKISLLQWKKCHLRKYNATTLQKMPFQLILALKNATWQA
jgi:hypothetical protein